MCGCMLTHATMNHSKYQPAPETSNVPVITPPTSDYTCAHCGFPLRVSYAFCPFCGKNLHSVNCPACGQNVDPSWAACAYCGSPLGQNHEGAACH